MSKMWVKTGTFNFIRYIPEIGGLLEVQDVFSILGGAWITPLKIEFKKMIMYVSFSYSIVGKGI